MGQIGKRFLAGIEPLRIEFSQLQHTEKVLDRRRGVAIRPGVDDWKLKPGQTLLHHRTSMPGCVVDHYGRILHPSRALAIELMHELHDEGRHHVCIGVGLRQGEPDASFGVNCC